MAPPFVLRQGSSAHRAYVAVGVVAALAVALAVPFLLAEKNVVLVSKGLAFAVAVLGLNLVTGYSGQLSLGHSAFMGVGAYTTAILVADHRWSYFWTIPVSALLCFAVGVLVGIPALRLKGLYLALATLGLAVIFPNLVKKLDSLTGGTNGKNIPVRKVRWLAPSWLSDNARGDAYKWTYLLILAFAAVLFVLARNIVRSRPGRSLVALRDNPIGAAASGVDVARAKVLTFGLSAAYAGVAGSLYMFTTTNASPSSYSLDRSIELITGVVVGGLASLGGSLLGGLLVVFLPEWSKNWGSGGTLANAVYGAMLIAIIAIYPGGVANLVGRLWSAVVRVVPGRPANHRRTTDVRETDLAEATER